MCDTRCMCLPSATGTFCGWIDREDGVVHPCAPGCCNPACSERAPSFDVGEYKQTRGVSLPPGFGLNLKTSDDPTSYKWQSDFEPVPRGSDGSVYSRRFFILLFLVALMVLMALLLV